MKLFFICMLAFVWGAHATGYSQQQTVSLDLKQCDVNTLFQEIWKQTGLRFVYNEKDIQAIRPLDISVENQSVEKLLEKIFRDTPCQASFESDVIYITLRPATPQRQVEMVKLSGTVKDHKGIPLPGVTVVIGTSGQGTVTDIDGNYQLSIPQGTRVEIIYSFVGMQKATYTFDAMQDRRHDVVLVEDKVQLQDVVVIGYGTKSKRDVTSSVTSVTAEDMEKFSNGAVTVDNMLGGAMKGVLVQQSSGKPGAAATINVRGITSPVSGSTNEPLYVIDGVPFFLNKDADGMNPLLTISPNDIKSIDVLKDAAATSIYGSRGANGVVIINTTNGQRNQKMRIHAGYTLSVANPVKKYKPLNRSEFIDLQDQLIRGTLQAVEAGQIDANSVASMPGFMGEMMSEMMGMPYVNLGVTPIYDPDDPFMMTVIGFDYNGVNEDYFGKADTDWVRETQNKNALTHAYNVGITGGSESTNYSFTFNATNQEGTLINDKLERYGARIAIDSDISKRFKAGGSLNYTYSKRRLGNDLSYMYSTKDWTFRPDVPVKNEDGTWGTGDGVFSYYMDADLANPVASRQKQNRNNSSQFIGSSYLEVKILDNLKIRGDINISLFNDHLNSFNPTYSMDDYMSAMGMDPINNMTESQTQIANTSVTFRADYNLDIDKHHAAFMAGYAWDRSFTENSMYMFSNFPDDYVLTNISSAGSADGWSGTKSRSGLNSVFARASYNYDEKYLVEFNFRSDVSSKFGPGNKRAYFPALSLGWRMSQEKFMDAADFVSDLKLRFSIGQTGSTNVADFSYRQFFTRGSSVLYEGQPGIVPSSTFPNHDVKWEMTTEYNGGIDFSFFEYRLFGSIDAYYRFTDGALAPSPLPFETGATTFYSNLIDMSNRGLELEIGGHIIQNDNVRWTSKFNIAFNRNRVEKFNSANLNEYQTKAYVEGEPAGVLQGYVVEKIFQSDEEVELMNAAAHAKNPNVLYYQNSGTGAGDYKYKDLNGDGTITDADQTIIAKPEPRFFGGFVNTVSYQDFTLSFAFQFSQGTKALLEQLQIDAYGSLGNSIYRELYGNTWTPERPDATYARLFASDPNNPSSNCYTSDKYVFNTSYLRLKNINLSYNIPQSILKKINLSSAQVFASLNNIWTLTQWPGLDPEVLDTSTGLGGYTTNDDPYPLSKSFSIGVRVEF